MGRILEMREQRGDLLPVAAEDYFGFVGCLLGSAALLEEEVAAAAFFGDDFAGAGFAEAFLGGAGGFCLHGVGSK